MTSRFPVLALACALAAISCRRGPTTDEALAAMRAARPALDASPVMTRLWQDGPPWFSCAEVMAKLRSPADSASVRDQVGNWRDLIVAGWATAHDTVHAPVAEPGWCTVKLSLAAAQRARGWQPLVADSFPAGGPRRGWSVLVGARRLEVTARQRADGDDDVTVRYLVTVAANEDGRALGAARDTTRIAARLRRADGRWTVAAITRD